MSWAPVDRRDDAIPGAIYRVRFSIRSPYNVKNINATVQALHTGAGVLNLATFGAMRRMVTIREVEAYSELHPDAVPYTSDKAEPWELRVTFKKTESGTPVYVVVGAILAVLALVIGVTGWTVEKFNEGPAGPILSIGVVALIAFAGLYFLGWRVKQ